MTFTPVVHLGPEVGSGFTRCCKRTPFDLPRTDQMTPHGEEVTCPNLHREEPAMTTATDPKRAIDPRVYTLDSIAESIEYDHPAWASDLRGISESLSRAGEWSREAHMEVGELVAGLRARLLLAEKAMSTIEDEHHAIANPKYCGEGSCHWCQVIEQVNLALAGEA